MASGDNKTTVSGKESQLSTEGMNLMKITFFVEGVVGVLCALYSMRRSIQRGQSGTFSFYTSLAIADLGLASLSFVTAYASASTVGGWPFDQNACDAYGFFAILVGSACIWSSLMVVVEGQLGSKGYKKLIAALLVITWLNALFWSAAPILGLGRYLPERYGAACLYDRDLTDETAYTYFLCYPVAAFVVPLGILFYTTASTGSGFQAPFLIMVAVFACWGGYMIEETWVLVAGNEDKVPMEVSIAAPVTAKLAPIVNAYVVGMLAGLAPPVTTRKSNKKE